MPINGVSGITNSPPSVKEVSSATPTRAVTESTENNTNINVNTTNPDNRSTGTTDRERNVGDNRNLGRTIDLIA
jgi:hypothetical protein